MTRQEKEKIKNKLSMLLRDRFCNGSMDCENYPECPEIIGGGEQFDGCVLDIIDKLFKVRKGLKGKNDK